MQNRPTILRMGIMAKAISLVVGALVFLVTYDNHAEDWSWIAGHVTGGGMPIYTVKTGFFHEVQVGYPVLGWDRTVPGMANLAPGADVTIYGAWSGGFEQVPANIICDGCGFYMPSRVVTGLHPLELGTLLLQTSAVADTTLLIVSFALFLRLRNR